MSRNIIKADFVFREQLRRRFPGLGRRRGGVPAPKLLSLQAVSNSAATAVVDPEVTAVGGHGGGGGLLRPSSVTKSSSFSNLKIG